MANPKKLKTWKRASMAAQTSQETVQRQARDYCTWLATQRGWFVTERPCKHCNGTGRQQFGRHRRLTTCFECSGKGRKYLSDPEPDIARAESYCYQQQRDLEVCAEEAVDGIRHRLFWHGFRPVAGDTTAVHSLAEYDARETKRAALDRDISAAWELVAELRAESNWAAMQPGFDWNAPSETVVQIRAAENLAEEIRRESYALGIVDIHRWAIPGTDDTIHVGIGPARRGYGYVPSTYSIIVKPGMAPSGTELDAMVDEILAAIAGNESLPLAA